MGSCPPPNKQLPGAQSILTCLAQPTSRNRKRRANVHYVLTQYFNVAARGGGSPPSGSGGGVDELGPGQTLYPGQNRTSGNGRYAAAFQADGNLVLYRLTDGRALWAHRYRTGWGSRNARTTATSSSITLAASRFGTRARRTMPAPAFVQDDGNVVIYDYYGYPVWATGTVQ